MDRNTRKAAMTNTPDKSEMVVEQVARAICDSRYPDDPRWPILPESVREHWRDYARAAIAALQAVPAASEVGWQPIESAPKDGKLVVFWQREFGLHVARWNDGFEEWHGTDWEHTSPIDPTHWMRPEPPALKASGEE
jgi:hypothetical protein